MILSETSILCRVGIGFPPNLKDVYKRQEVGCNSVLNPGTVIGRNSNIYPLSRVRGVVPENSIFKELNDIVEKK